MTAARTPRLIAGAAVLLILIVLAVLLIPPYASNWKLQSYVNDLADDSATAQRPVEAIRTQVVNKAAELGLPVHDSDVHVTKSQGTVKIDVLYIVQLSVGGYAVDLHFRPAAGS